MFRVSWALIPKFGKKWKRIKHVGNYWRNNTRTFPIVEGQILGLNETYQVPSTISEKGPHQGKSGIRKKL